MTGKISSNNVQCPAFLKADSRMLEAPATVNTATMSLGGKATLYRKRWREAASEQIARHLNRSLLLRRINVLFKIRWRNRWMAVSVLCFSAC